MFQPSHFIGGRLQYSLSAGCLLSVACSGGNSKNVSHLVVIHHPSYTRHGRMLALRFRFVLTYARALPTKRRDPFVPIGCQQIPIKVIECRNDLPLANLRHFPSVVFSFQRIHDNECVHEYAVPILDFAFQDYPHLQVLVVTCDLITTCRPLFCPQPSQQCPAEIFPFEPVYMPGCTLSRVEERILPM